MIDKKFWVLCEITPQYIPTNILQISLTNQLNGIKKAEKFMWNKEIERDFMELKKAFTKGGIQAFPNFGVGDRFIQTTDGSKENITGVLSQVQDGQERFLGCWGRKCRSGGFFILSVRQKIRFIKDRCGCDTCLTKTWSMPVRAGEHVPSLTRYVREKMYVDLVSMSETIRINLYMLTAEDSFSRYCRAYMIPNKEAHTLAKVLMDQHFNVYGLPDQLHSYIGKEFVNNFRRELFFEFKIQHTMTLPYKRSSNPVESFHRTLTAMLKSRGLGVQNNWDLWLNASVCI